MKVKVRISLLNDMGEPFMGIGLVWLLERIDKFNSIRQAAMDMNMSYAKAHRIIVDLEKNLGNRVVDRQAGGVEGGGAVLTDFGREFLTRYRNFQEQIEKFTSKEFERFKKWLE